MSFKALAYKAGYTDSIVTSYNADYSGAPKCGGASMMMMGAMMSQRTTATIIYSVWDGDWAILRMMKVES